jgi:RsmE family RNA methyltransferase
LATFAREAATAGTPIVLADAEGNAPSLDRPVVAVGPEGGWSDAERALCVDAVALGDAVLRSETAAVAAGTLLAGLRSGLIAAAAGCP